jgi:hypothetical protein
VSYPELRETPSADPAQRTRWNVRDSDATLVLDVGPVDAAGPPRTEVPSSGTELSEGAAATLGRPLLRVDATAGAKAREAFGSWLAGLPSQLVLNVAGPRESEAPGTYASGLRLLGLLLG